MQIMELLVQQLNTNLVHKSITLSVTHDVKRWDSGEVLGAELRGAAHCGAAAAVCRRSASERIAAGFAAAAAFLWFTWRTTSLFYRRSPGRMGRQTARTRLPACATAV